MTDDHSPAHLTTFTLSGMPSPPYCAGDLLRWEEPSQPTRHFLIADVRPAPAGGITIYATPDPDDAPL